MRRDSNVWIRGVRFGVSRAGTMVFWSCGLLLAATTAAGLVLLGFSDAPSLHGVVRLGFGGVFAAALAWSATGDTAAVAAARWTTVVCVLISVSFVATVFSLLPEHHTIAALNRDIRNYLSDVQCPPGVPVKDYRLGLTVSASTIGLFAAALVPIWGVAAQRATKVAVPSGRWALTGVAVVPVLWEIGAHAAAGAQAAALIAIGSAGWLLLALRHQRASRNFASRDATAET